MGIVIHILDRRRARLDVAGTIQDVGTLRHLGKVTELDGRRAAELEAVDRLEWERCLHASARSVGPRSHPVVNGSDA